MNNFSRDGSALTWTLFAVASILVYVAHCIGAL